MNPRIALINNMANNFFVLARYFLDLGFDCHLFITNPDKWHPREDTISFGRYEDRVHTIRIDTSLSAFEGRSISIDQTTIRMLKTFDIIVACGYIPLFLERAGIRCHIFIPYGGDFNDPVLEADSIRRNPLFSPITRFYSEHYSSIQRQTVVLAEYYQPIWHTAKITGISVYDVRIPLLYLPEIDLIPPLNNDPRPAEGLRVMSHSRHLWRSNYNAPLDYTENGGIKRNDRYIRGFAKFLRFFPSSPHTLLLINYGEDYLESLRLCEEIGITNNIVTVNSKLSRRDIVSLLKNSDIAFNAFRENLFDFGGVAKEAMACGRVLFNYMGCSTGYESAPVINCLNADEISLSLSLIWQNRWMINSIGTLASKWYRANYDFALARQYAELAVLLTNSSLSSLPVKSAQMVLSIFKDADRHGLIPQISKPAGACYLQFLGQ